MIRRKIAVLTGKRGGYGAMKPMLRALDNDPTMGLSLIVTDQHINPIFGATRTEVERDFRIAAAVDLEQAGGSARQRARALGVGLSRMADVLDEIDPDILVLYGDRGEVLSTALAAVTMGIAIAHVQGGDVSGNIDDPMRHAITKLAHLHFTSTETSAARIRSLGEEPWRVQVVGDCHADPIVAGDYSDAATIRQRYGIANDDRPILLLYHPETIALRDGGVDMRAILTTVLARGRRTLIVYPCSDPGYEEIVEAIEATPTSPVVSVHRNIDAQDFLGLLAIASVLVGNSSAGLIETPYFQIPAINVGGRQRGREHAENVIHCGHGEDEVAAALTTALDDQAFAARVAHCARPFGDGRAGERIVAALKAAPVGTPLLDKRLAG